jgi:hypothetical protein
MPFNHTDADLRTKIKWHGLLETIKQLPAAAQTQSGNGATTKMKVFISYAWYAGDNMQIFSSIVKSCHWQCR